MTLFASSLLQVTTYMLLQQRYQTELTVIGHALELESDAGPNEPISLIDR